MLKFLPIVVVVILMISGLLYIRFRPAPPAPSASTSQPKPSITQPQAQDKKLSSIADNISTGQTSSLEDRVKILEDSTILIAKKIGEGGTAQTVPGSNIVTTTSSDYKIKTLEETVVSLQKQIDALKQPTTQTTTKAPSVYIPLGSGGSINTNYWTSLNAFQVTLDPAQYPGYSSMQLEVNMRLNQPGGTLYVRLYNATSGSATSSEANTTSTNSSLSTSTTFTLPAGSKTYVLQAKTSDATPGFLDMARIKVTF